MKTLVALVALVAAGLAVAAPSCAPPPEYNVQSYGAKGDGVTNDGPAIQAAIDAAAPSHGTVFFPPGIYQLVLPAAERKAAVTVKTGETLHGPGAVLRTNTVGRSQYDALLGIGDSSTPAPGVTLEDLTFDGQEHDPAIGYEWTMGVNVFPGTTDLHITGTHTRYLAGDGISAGEITPGAGVARVTVDHNEAVGDSGQAFAFTDTAGTISITDNSVHDNMQVGGNGQNTTEAIWALNDTTNVTIARNTVTSWGNVFIIGSSGVLDSNTVTAAPGAGNLGTMMNVAGNGVLAENNTIDANGATQIKGVVVENPFSSSPSDGVTIRNNTIKRFSGTNDGILLVTATTHLTVDGNTVNGGTNVSPTYPDFFAPQNNVSQCTIMNNHLDSNTPSVAYWENLTSCTVSGNTHNGVPF